MIETKCDGCGQVIERRPSNSFGINRNYAQFENEHFDFCNACIIKVKNVLLNLLLPPFRERLIKKFITDIEAGK